MRAAIALCLSVACFAKLRPVKDLNPIPPGFFGPMVLETTDKIENPITMVSGPLIPTDPLSDGPLKYGVGPMVLTTTSTWKAPEDPAGGFHGAFIPGDPIWPEFVDAADIELEELKSDIAPRVLEWQAPADPAGPPTPYIPGLTDNTSGYHAAYIPGDPLWPADAYP